MKMTFKELFLFSPHEKKAKIITFENGINVITSNQEDGTDRGKSVVMRSLYHALGAESFFEAKWDTKSKIYVLHLCIDDKEYYIPSSRVSSDIPDSLPIAAGVKGEYQKYALSLLPDFGWDSSELTPLIYLWNKESGWNPLSHNKSSGAHGIPQALPASKMASEGSDYYTSAEPQIRWGLKYIAGRYGSPSNAWAHWCSTGWY